MKTNRTNRTDTDSPSAQDVAAMSGEHQTHFARIATTVALSSLFGIADAAITTYTNETTFRTAAGAVTTYDFDGFVLTNGPDIYGMYVPLDQQIAGIDFDNSRVNLGAFGGTSLSAPNVVLNADFVSPIAIKFDAPRVAVGLYNTSIVDAERVDAFDANSVLLGSISLGASAINFGGFVSSTPIAQLTITPIAPTNGSIYIDNLLVGAVPELSTYLMFLSGIATVSASVYRRTRAARRRDRSGESAA